MGLFEVEDSGAVFSDCRSYRYRLWRRWESGGVPVAFVMLNPSTADDRVDDPTIRRCVSFAKQWEYPALEVVNLYAFRATEPKHLQQTRYPISERSEPGKNLGAILAVADCVDAVVCAWGSRGLALHQGDSVLAFLRERCGRKLYALGLNRDGTPKHPLYVPLKTPLRSF